MSKNSRSRDTPEYKKAIKLDSQPGAGIFSLSHAPAMLIPLLVGTFLLSIGMPVMQSALFTLWIFTSFLFVIRDKPERFIRRMLGSRRKHWKRKLSRSKSLFDRR